jgi:lysozyme family protein
MKDLPIETARAIYADQYWTPAMEGIQSSAIAAKILDFRVNFGQGGGTIIAQQAANQFEGVDIAEDGGLGLATVEAINSIDPSAYMDALVQEAADHYRAIAASDPDKASSLPGWLARVVKIPIDNPLASSSVLLFLIVGAAVLMGRK